MGYAVKTNKGVDFYEDAVSIRQGSSFLHVKDKNDENLAIYYPGHWTMSCISSTPPSSTELSVPPEVISLLNSWLTSDESKEASQYPYEVISEFVLTHSKEK